MLRTFALVGFAAALVFSANAAFAQPPSGYGTEGPNGERLHRGAISSFDRHWNNFNQSKWRAEQSAEWVREHGGPFSHPF
jgi:hypothetical protein